MPRGKGRHNPEHRRRRSVALLIDIVCKSGWAACSLEVVISNPGNGAEQYQSKRQHDSGTKPDGEAAARPPKKACETEKHKHQSLERTAVRQNRNSDRCGVSSRDPTVSSQSR